MHPIRSTMMATVAAVMCVLVAHPASGRDIYVAPSGDDGAPGTAAAPIKSLKKAIELARPTDTIRLAPGIYEGGIETSCGSLKIVGPREAIVRGPKRNRAIEIFHDGVTLSGFTIDQADIGVWLFGVKKCVLEDLTICDIGGEGVRIKNGSHSNIVRRCRFERMGRTGFDASRGMKNGEGVYIGTAPEQRSKNRPPNVPDRCTSNLIVDCEFRTEAAEAVDIKEDSERNIVRNCTAIDSRDPDGAIFGSRGDHNSFERCIATDGAGHGFRFGGDTVRKGEHGQPDDRTYGKHNVMRHCRATGNGIWGAAPMVHPQNIDQTNQFESNGRGAIKPE